MMCRGLRVVAIAWVLIAGWLDFTATASAQASVGKFTVLHRFARDTDGAYPNSPLIQGMDGNFYGTTVNGGATGAGTIFRLTRAGLLTTLHSFTVEENEPSGGPLLQTSDGNFYGCTLEGGTFHAGTFYRLSPAGTFTTLYNFTVENRNPSGGLTLGTDGNFYGISTQGGDRYQGAIFRITPDGTLTTLHTFSPSDGRTPVSSLLLASDGNFYGTTIDEDHDESYGTIFRVSPVGVFATLHTFNSTDGSKPVGTLIQARDGNLYGTTAAGGNDSFYGTVFRITLDGTLTTLHVFSGLDGENPAGGLVEGDDGNFYGVTGIGGATYGANFGSGFGEIFQITPAGALSVLHSFDSIDGYNPFGALLRASDSNLYGATEFGGNSCGEIFALSAASSVPTVTLSANVPTATVGGAQAGEFIVGLSAVQDHDVVVSLTIKGSAINGADYVLLKTTKKIKAGKTSKPIKIVPQGNLGGAPKKVVTLLLAPGDGYTVGTAVKVKVKILAPGN